MRRRKALQLIALSPLAASITWSSADAAVAQELVLKTRRENARTGRSYEPKFFTAHEFATVTLLADMIIPADERSGSASDVGVPEFIDFMMTDQPDRQLAMRGGLAWIDAESRRRSGKRFVDASESERMALLDSIAFPGDAPEHASQGVAFFNSFRDLVATGFFTSKVGIEDLQYMGNTFVVEWNGCPPECYHHLGVEPPQG